MIFSDILSILESFSHLGEKKYSDGAKQIGYIPHKAPLAYLHVLFRPLTIEDIYRIEDVLHCSLPDQYKEFLFLTNGINLFSDSLSLDGLRTSYDRTGNGKIEPYDIQTPNIEERPKDAKNSFVFIGGYNFDGSHLYIDTNTGKVFRCERWHSLHILNEWKDFWTMLSSEVERLNKLFDKDGRRIDPQKPTTPDSMKK